MKFLFEITSKDAAKILVPMASACNRAGISWSCFFTGEGVLCLSNEEANKVIKTATLAIVCEISWETHIGETTCPVKLGSQTNNSEIVGDCDKIISL